MLRFNCTMLQGLNKTGIVKPDENGYYELVLGALDFDNSVGATYPSRTAEALFKASSSLMRRVRNGYCRGEYGHPKRVPGMSYEDFLRRIMTIEETQVSHHIKEVRIDTTSVKHAGRPVVAIIGKIKPAGPYASALKDQLENPDENVAFSIRSITEDTYVGGKLHKNLIEITTWDYVTEPGLSVANKYQAPGLEDLEDLLVDIPTLQRTADQMVLSGVGTESVDRLKGIISRLQNRPKLGNIVIPPSAKW